MWARGETSDAGAALAAGWRAFPARPWALMAGQLAFLALGLWSAVWALFASLLIGPPEASNSALEWLAVLGLLLVGIIPWWLAWVGLAEAARRAVRGEAPTAGAFFTGVRHPLATTWAGVFGHGLLLGALVLAFLPVAVAIAWDRFRDGLSRFALLAGDLGSGAVWAWILVLTMGFTVLAALAVTYALAVMGFAVASLAPWGFMVAEGAGLRALPAGWARVRGRRWPFLGLLAALFVLNLLGLMALYVGVVVTGAVSTCVLAAFLAERGPGADSPAPVETPSPAPMGPSAPGPAPTEPPAPAQIAAPAPAEPPAPAARPRRWSAWALDGWLAYLVAANTTLLVIVLLTRPILDLARQAQPTYGLALSGVAALGSCVVAMGLYALAARRRPPSPGRRLAGTGWGRFEWLAVPIAAVLVIQLATLVVALASAVGSFAALGVGQEMGRVLMADLPPGFEASAGYAGGEDWFGLLETEGGRGSDLVQGSYTITNTAGTPYYFKVVRYYRLPTAKIALGRMLGPLGQPVTDLGDAAVVVRYPAVVRLATRVGDTVIAAEGPAVGEAELRDLMARQLARLDLARSRTAPVYRWLPKSVQRLAPHPMARPTPRTTPSATPARPPPG